jgi:hypothetical protein
MEDEPLYGSPWGPLLLREKTVALPPPSIEFPVQTSFLEGSQNSRNSFANNALRKKKEKRNMRAWHCQLFISGTLAFGTKFLCLFFEQQDKARTLPAPQMPSGSGFQQVTLCELRKEVSQFFTLCEWDVLLENFLYFFQLGF